MHLPDDGWNVAVREHRPREIPDVVREVVASTLDIVEEISDRYRARGWRLSINLHDIAGMLDTRKAFVGPVVTARFVPRAMPGEDTRLGHDRIAAEATLGSIVILEAKGCDGSILGGNAAAKLRQAGVDLCIVDGMARDWSEIKDTGLVVAAERWGVEGGRGNVELSEVGGPLILRGTTIRSTDVAIVNRWGMIVIPPWLPWDLMLDWTRK